MNIDTEGSTRNDCGMSVFRMSDSGGIVASVTGSMIGLFFLPLLELLARRSRKAASIGFLAALHRCRFDKRCRCQLLGILALHTLHQSGFVKAMLSIVCDTECFMSRTEPG